MRPNRIAHGVTRGLVPLFLLIVATSLGVFPVPAADPAIAPAAASPSAAGSPSDETAPAASPMADTSPLRPAPQLARRDKPKPSAAGKASADKPRPQASAIVIGDLLKTLLFARLPKAHEDRKHWDLTEEVVSGVKWTGQGFGVRPHWKKQEVKHGLWKRHKVWVEDPVRDIHIELRRARTSEDNVVRFNLAVQAKLQLEAEIKEYRRGVQLFGVTIVGSSDVQAILRCEVGLDWVGSGWNAKLAINPVVKESFLELHGFDLARIGKFDGKLTEEIGKRCEDIIKDELAEQGHKVTAAANKAIAKSKAKGDLTIAPWKLISSEAE